MATGPATAPAVTRGNDLSFRPGQPVPAYRRQGWAPATERSSHVRGLGPWCCRAGGRPCRSRAGAARPRAGGQGTSRWLLPGGQRGLSAAALARVRGGCIKVIIAWRRARRLGRLCRRHQPPPGDPGQMPRCPGLPPSRIRRRCAHRVPVDAPAGPGGMRYLARYPATARLPTPGPPGGGMMLAQPSPVLHRHGQDLTGLPRASRSCRHGLAGLALAGRRCLLRAAVSPHRPPGALPGFFRIMAFYLEPRYGIEP